MAEQKDTIPKPTDIRFIDLEGQKFSSWTVLSYAGRRPTSNRGSYWFCQCSCGRICEISGGSLRAGGTHCCQTCFGESRRHDIKGQTFHQWTVLSFAGFRPGKISRLSLWNCRCSCGVESVVYLGALKNGTSKSCINCGREATRKVQTTHGETVNNETTAEYRAFCNAKNRCENPKSERFYLYGQRGIEFRFASFEEFLAELGRRPSANHSVNRIDNDGHYELGNVEWATATEQANNRRPRRKIVQDI